MTAREFCESKGWVNPAAQNMVAMAWDAATADSLELRKDLEARFRARELAVAGYYRQLVSAAKAITAECLNGPNCRECNAVRAALAELDGVKP